MKLPKVETIESQLWYSKTLGQYKCQIGDICYLIEGPNEYSAQPHGGVTSGCWCVPESGIPLWLVLLLTKIAYVDGAYNTADDMREYLAKFQHERHQ